MNSEKNTSRRFNEVCIILKTMITLRKRSCKDEFLNILGNVIAPGEQRFNVGIPAKVVGQYRFGDFYLKNDVFNLLSEQ